MAGEQIEASTLAASAASDCSTAVSGEVSFETGAGKIEGIRARYLATVFLRLGERSISGAICRLRSRL
jgi:hypothetical protein